MIFILYAVFAYSKFTPFPGLYALVPTIGTVLIIVFATQQTTVGKFIGNRFFVGIGLISYSAYLWHQPLFAFARHRSLEEPSHLVFALLSVFSVILAYFSWRFVENPFRNKAIFSRKFIVSSAFLLSFFFFAFGLFGHFSGGFKDRMPVDVLRVDMTEEVHLLLRDDGGCNLFKDQTVSPECVKGYTSVNPTFALFGDSHAASLAFELEKYMEKIQKSYIQFTKNACPVAVTFDDNNDQDCRLFISNALESLENSSIHTIIIVARWNYYIFDEGFNNLEGGREFRGDWRYTALNVPLDADISLRRNVILGSYKSTIEKLLAANKKVILVYPFPEQGWDVPKIAAKRMLFRSEKNFSFGVNSNVIAERNRYVVDLFDSLEDSDQLVRIRPFDLLCDTFLPRRCVAYSKEKTFYYDDNHPSNEGARLLVRAILSSIE